MSGETYTRSMVTLNAHFDGKTIVLDEPFKTDIAVGTRLKILVEMIDKAGDAKPTVTSAPRVFQPLNIQIDPDLSNAIALDPEFNIEES
jgi:hypothetical protein